MPDYLHEWYYLEPNWRGNTFVRGPYDIDRMRAFIKEGTINDKTQVRCGTSSYWHPLRDVDAVFGKPMRRGKPVSNRTGLSRNQKILALVVASVIVVLALTKAGPPPVKESNRESFRQEPLSKEAIIALTNNARAEQGLAMLKENHLLDAVAESRAKDMIERQYFDHVSPTGEQASDIAQRVGYHYKIIAENIASGLFFTNRKIVDGWIQSPGHRKNLLSSEVQEIGASVIRGNMKGADTWVSVQIFGLPSLPVSEKSCVVPSQELLREIQMKRAEIAGLDERVTKLKQELDAEHNVIELDRIIAGNDTQMVYDLNVKIRAYNEKSAWHNRSLSDKRAKEGVLNSMVEEYNRALQGYKDCMS